MDFPIEIHRQALERFCEKWRVAKLDLFGSALRDDFRPDSDIDILVSFDSEASPTLKMYAQMEDELASIFERSVDLVSRVAVEESRNWIRKQDILKSARPIFRAA